MDNNTKNQDKPPSWFKDGLRFECQRCGRCCRGEPGAVWVNKSEMGEITSFLGITPAAFAKNYLRSINGRLSLLEYGNGVCVMYDGGCKIYGVRPGQCRAFPFWTSNLESREDWEKLQNTCPGAGKGKLYTPADIEGCIAQYDTTATKSQ
ncbi:MAG: YkgJ family cysteine cluster protein [Planctomycetes bacterium]|nr:YkgJ family cysteine cluster protein [Planctomycetota bacterium]